MDQMNKRVAELLQNKTIDLFIGYGKGTGDRIRALFINAPEEADNLIFNDKCEQNLAVYLLKDEVRQSGKRGFLATGHALRAMLQQASEFQFKDGDILVLHITNDNQLMEFRDFKSIEDYLLLIDTGLSAEEKEKVLQIRAMGKQERWDFWMNEFSRCIKCYACRAACPLCYCHRCTTDVNRPQWIPVASHDQGNLNWHLMRAMHLSGRCVNCGDCAKACPMDIPLNFLTYCLVDDIENDFNFVAGMKSNALYALSTFKPDDKEEFIL
jgi:formate dehydrogenase (coenzyme F420) beta subunit